MNPELFAHHSARCRTVPVQAKPIGSSDPYKTIGWADPGTIKLAFDGSWSDDGVMVTTTAHRGGEVSFIVEDETHLFTRELQPFQREMLRKIYSKPGTIHVTNAQRESSMSRIDTIQSRLRDLEAELADIKRFGDDTHDDGTVITFKGDFGGEKTYTYAAIKAGGKWHLTGGKAIQHASWEDLVEFMRGANVRKVRLVTDTERIV